MNRTSTKLSTNAPWGKPPEQRLVALQQEITQHAHKHARNADDIRLLAVSKKHDASAIQALYEVGQREFGENYVQEALSKMPRLPADCIWHFIGPIQSNKTADIAAHFDWVHSVDRPKIAQRLNDQRPDNKPPLNVFVQVNISAETSKSGAKPDEVLALCDHISQLPHLQLRGLMCIPQAASDFQAQYAAFKALKDLQDQITPRPPELSIGMSADMEAAIAAGSTCVRIGTALFGPRDS